MQLFHYDIDPKYDKPVAYFSMEFAIHQALKIYSGGLGFLAGSHMRSVHDLGQNEIGIGILWSYGYYDQSRNEDRSLRVDFRRKYYYFLEDTGVKVTLDIHGHPVVVKAWLLKSETFGSAPIILLSTDIDDNDFLARTITHKLYDANEETRVAQEIVLGIGGVRVLQELGHNVDIYHMNEGHALPLVFELMKQYPEIDDLKQHIVFTTHTPETAGNETHNVHFLQKMGFFNGFRADEIQNKLNYYDNDFSLTVGALKMAKITNAVSKIHGKVSNEMWGHVEGRSQIISVTNAQNRKYWMDKPMARALEERENYEIEARKKHLKRNLFEIVANQTGKMFDEDVLTIVWARRFAAYKRPALLKHDFERFHHLLERDDRPIQVIWAGKPYPLDTNSINIFNELIYTSHRFKRMAVLVGYELRLSRLLKQGSDVWLNTPRITREASGTSGMTASMNGSIHFSIADGWHPEFAKHGVNSFTIPGADRNLNDDEQDHRDHAAMMNVLENEIIPTYYGDPKRWNEIVMHAMSDVMHDFNSDRMAHQYYEEMYRI